MRPAVSSRRRARNTVSDRFCKSNASSSASAGVLTDPASHPDDLPILFDVHLARGRSAARHSPYGTLFSSMTDTLTPTRDDFAALLDQQLQGRTLRDHLGLPRKPSGYQAAEPPDVQERA